MEEIIQNWKYWVSLLVFMACCGVLGATVAGADKKKPLKKKEARPNTCCTLNYATDDGYPGVKLRQVCFGKTRTTVIITQDPSMNICYVPSGLHLIEDNGKKHTALSVHGAELCRMNKTSYKTRPRASLIFPAVRRGLKSFSIWEDDVIQPPGFKEFRWSHVSLAKCYMAR